MYETPDLQIKNQVSPSSEWQHLRHGGFLRMVFIYFQLALQISIVDLHNGHHSPIWSELDLIEMFQLNWIENHTKFKPSLGD